MVDPLTQGGPTADAPGAVIPGGFKAGLATRASFPGEPKPKVPIPVGGEFKPAQQGGGATRKADIEDNGFNVLMMADQAMVAMRKRDLNTRASIIGQVDHLSKDDQQSFKAAMALRQYFSPEIDPEFMSELAGCTMVALMRSQEAG